MSYFGFKRRHQRPISKDNKVSIWDEWATAEQTARFGRPEHELGPVYGHQWRNFGATKNADGTYNQDGFDQIKWLINEIKTNPNSRRLIISGWNPNEAGQVALPPCHTLFQFSYKTTSCHASFINVVPTCFRRTF